MFASGTGNRIFTQSATQGICQTAKGEKRKENRAIRFSSPAPEIRFLLLIATYAVCINLVSKCAALVLSIFWPNKVLLPDVKQSKYGHHF